MVDTGHGPRAAGVVKPAGSRGYPTSDRHAFRIADGWFGTLPQFETSRTVPRWWIVEADNALAARLAIKATETHDQAGRAYSEEQRRVFANCSGGARVHAARGSSR